MTSGASRLDVDGRGTPVGRVLCWAGPVETFTPEACVPRCPINRSARNLWTGLGLDVGLWRSNCRQVVSSRPSTLRSANSFYVRGVYSVDPLSIEPVAALHDRRDQSQHLRARRSRLIAMCSAFIVFYVVCCLVTWVVFMRQRPGRLLGSSRPTRGGCRRRAGLRRRCAVSHPQR
jgi:hypothetical protein